MCTVSYQLFLTLFCRNQGETQGNLIKEILDQVENDQSMHSFAHADSTTENVRHVDRALVDLITDDETQRIGQMLKKLERDSDGSLSEDFSDIDDPIHEESLLTELFYTAKQVSELISSKTAFHRQLQSTLPISLSQIPSSFIHESMYLYASSLHESL